MKETFETVAAICGAVTGIVSLIGIGIMIGAFKSSIASLDSAIKSLQEAISLSASKEALSILSERIKEDRAKNEKQHEDFYKVENSVERFAEKFLSIDQRLGNVETGIGTLLERIPPAQK